jgi:predicted transcriptional regulator
VSRSKKAQPTEAELAILRVLWSRGPSTVREVHETLGGDARTRYTTTLKQLQVMAEKRLVSRHESRRSHVYTAIAKETETEESLVSGFVDRVFQGSVQKMVLHALSSGKVTDEEIAQIKRLLEKWEERK